jgi:thiol:disulfide interchange protein DsbD
MFLTSLWLAWVALNQTGMESLSILLLSFFVLLVCVVVIKYIGRKSIISLASIVIFLNLILVLSFIPDSKPNNQKKISLGEKWSSERVMELRVQKKNILVNFTADWCLTCKVNERVIKNSEEFKKMVGSITLGLDKRHLLTNNPEITEQLAYYKRAGVPLYLYWRAGSDEVNILPAILTKGILYDHLDIESY